jgi:hypothetical protein
MAAGFVATGATPEVVVPEREKIRELLTFLYSTPAYWRTFGLADRITFPVPDDAGAHAKAATVISRLRAAARSPRADPNRAGAAEGQE